MSRGTDFDLICTVCGGQCGEQMSKSPRESDSKHAIMCRCDLCGNTHQMGPYRYDGQFLPHYQMQVCRTCMHSHGDGVSRAYEPRLIAHLKKHGIAFPGRNRKGLYPLEEVE